MIHKKKNFLKQIFRKFFFNLQYFTVNYTILLIDKQTVCVRVILRKYCGLKNLFNTEKWENLAKQIKNLQQKYFYAHF